MRQTGGALTSIENSTPPIGEPNATATPAALAAVTISRIFPESMSKIHQDRGDAVYLGYAKTARRVQQQDFRYSTQHVRMVPLCRRITQKL